MPDKKPLILAVITARGNSKGLPGKNIKILGGKPLIAYSIEIALKSLMITDCIVSTDALDIADIAKKYGANVPFIRPKELAEDKTPHVPVMQHAIDFMEKQKGLTYDYIVILQPTSPFRIVDDIDETLKLLISEKADSAVTIVEADSHEHPIKMKRLDGVDVVSYCIQESEKNRRQDISPAYKRSGAVYAMHRDLIMKDGLLFGNKVVGHLVPTDRSVDIDTPRDWYIAMYMLEDLKEKGYTW